MNHRRNNRLELVVITAQYSIIAFVPCQTSCGVSNIFDCGVPASIMPKYELDVSAAAAAATIAMISYSHMRRVWILFGMRVRTFRDNIIFVDIKPIDHGCQPQTQTPSKCKQPDQRMIQLFMSIYHEHIIFTIICCTSASIWQLILYYVCNA